jgi:hypothetical protein
MSLRWPTSEPSQVDYERLRRMVVVTGSCLTTWPRPDSPGGACPG